MRRQSLADTLVWSLAAVGTALVAGFALALTAGVFRTDGQAAARVVRPAPRPLATPTVVPEPAETEPARTTTAAPPAPPPRQTSVVITATRGDSWISARLGSESGRVLEERLLARGESTRLTGRRIWVLVGASGNVDVQVDGKPRELAAGTVETVFAS